jgi:hypothetical protein
VRLLCSDKTLAPLCDATRQSLIDKHPLAPVDRRPAPIPSAAPLTVNRDDILRAVRSFTPGERAGSMGCAHNTLRI